MLLPFFNTPKYATNKFQLAMPYRATLMLPCLLLLLHLPLARGMTFAACNYAGLNSTMAESFERRERASDEANKCYTAGKEMLPSKPDCCMLEKDEMQIFCSLTSPICFRDLSLAYEPEYVSTVVAFEHFGNVFNNGCANKNVDDIGCICNFTGVAFEQDVDEERHGRLCALDFSRPSNLATVPNKCHKLPPMLDELKDRDMCTETFFTAEPSPSPSPSPGVESNGNPPRNADDEASNPVCFPGSATVELESGLQTDMSHLQVGDSVQVGTGVFSPVFAFTHRTEDVWSQFVRVGTDTGHELLLTASHYLYVDGDVLAPAHTVVPGQLVQLGNGTLARVKTVGRQSAQGLYNPQTIHGDIVVNGVRASTYTTAVPLCTAHSALWPLRLFYERFGWYSLRLESVHRTWTELLSISCLFYK